MNPDRPPRDPSSWLPIAFATGAFLLIVVFVGHSIHVRHTRGAAVLAAFRTLAPGDVSRILLRPMEDHSRYAGPGALLPASLVRSEYEIREPASIASLVEAFREAQVATSDKTAGERWVAAMGVVTANGTLWCTAQSTSDGRTLLFFWSDGLKGFSYGVLQSRALTELVPRAAHAALPLERGEPADSARSSP